MSSDANTVKPSETLSTGKSASSERKRELRESMPDWVWEAKHMNMPMRSGAAIRNWENRPMIGGIVYHFGLLSDTLEITAAEEIRSGIVWRRG